MVEGDAVTEMYRFDADDVELNNIENRAKVALTITRRTRIVRTVAPLISDHMGSG